MQQLRVLRVRALTRAVAARVVTVPCIRPAGGSTCVVHLFSKTSLTFSTKSPIFSTNSINFSKHSIGFSTKSRTIERTARPVALLDEHQIVIDHQTEFVGRVIESIVEEQPSAPDPHGVHTLQNSFF